MNIEKITIEADALRKLLHMKSGDGALLYLYLAAGNDSQQAAQKLDMGQEKIACALANLRQMGLYEEKRKASFVPGERPAYSEKDLLTAMDTDKDFRSLYGEAQRLLGKVLSTEELKILLGFNRYLGLPNDVIALLICYCKERARSKNAQRSPGLRTIEKEAYHWAEQGIDTFEEAAAYIRSQNLKNSRMAKLMKILQIHGRELTAGEQRYAESWMDMGFDDSAIALAYERTCLNTGGLKWPYMNKILQSWHDYGLHTAQAVQQRNEKKADVPMGGGELGQAELDAIRKLMQEG